MTDDDSGREYRRFAFVVGCVLALVLAATLLPAVTAAFERSPIESLITPSGSGPGTGDADGSLGSLDPGRETTVGTLDGSTSESLRSLGPSVHFRVESSEPAYWRTGAYGTYTGSGWRQAGDPRRVGGTLDPPPRTDGTVSYRVRLDRTARALPTVWRPRRVSVRALATPRGGLRGVRPLGPGRTYEGVSARPPRDPDVLGAAGTDYPRAVADRYTQLPEDTPDRLGAFTDRLTAGADSPYETARRIEQFLERNKSYSLNVTTSSDHVASTFVFGMDRGYCEYFATSMTAMLRTQGIPARYVVGYSTGQPTGERTYTVRGMNAHAWVEVYVPDTGWVRFDPTPGGPRLAAERAALRRQLPDAPPYNHTETGSPGETFSPAGGDGGVGSPGGRPASGDASATAREDGTFDFSGNVTAVAPDDTDLPTPGEGEPIEDIVTSPGETDPANGSDAYDVALSGPPVPGGSLAVAVTREGDPVTGATVLFDGEEVGATGRNGTAAGRVPFAERLSVAVVPAGGNATVTRTYRTETNATLSVSGAVATNQSVLVTATVRGTPVPDAAVRVDGRRAGETDSNGRTRVGLPADPGTVTLSVSRDPVAGSRQLRLPELAVEVDPRLPLALPWSGATVTARLDGRPAAGLPVVLDGERVATTGVDGTATVTLPLADRARLAVGAHGQRADATVGGLWTNLAVSVGALGVVVGALAWRGRRRDHPVRDLLDRLADLLDRAVAAVLARLVVAADLMVELATGTQAVGDLLAGLVGRRADHGGRAATTDGGDDPAEHEVRLAWRRLIDRSSVENPATRTPGEIATHAVEVDGLPADHVETLRDAFRAVEYGGFDPGSRAGSVGAAAAAIDGTEPAVPGEDDDTHGTADRGVEE